MLEDPLQNSGFISTECHCKSKKARSGSIKASSVTRKKMAKESGKFNLEEIPIFIQLFPGKRKIFNRGTIDSLVISNV